MKLLAVCSLATLIAAQAFSQASPIGGLVHSTELPSHLLILSPDTATQILSNPSRAALYGRQFVYSTYVPEYSYLYSPYAFVIQPANPRKFQLTSLHQSNDGYLLIQAGNVLSGRNLDVQDNATYENKSPYENMTSEYSSNEVRRSNSNVYEARITTIQAEEASGWAYGVYGLYSPGNEMFDRDSKNLSKYYDPTTNVLRRINSQVSTSDEARENPFFELGLEYSQADPESDIILAAEWLRSSSQYDRLSYYEYLTDDVLNQYRTKSSSDEVMNNKGTSDAIRLRGLYRTGASASDRADQWVFAGSASYGFGDFEFGANRLYRTEYTSGGSTSVSEQITDEKVLSDRKSYDATGLLTYAFQQSWNDLQLLVGPTVSGFYRMSEEEGKRSENRREFSTTTVNIIPSPFKSEYRTHGVGLSIPLFAQLIIVEGFSILGGMTARWEYNESSTELSEELRDSSNNVVRRRDFVTSMTGRSSSQFVYFGMDLRHSGGLNLQVNFREDLASFREWSISLGYLF